VDNAVLDQLAELAQAFDTIGLKPVVCGGLGIYLQFRGQSDAVRATSDIDLMIPCSQALEETKRNAIAELISGNLQYAVREDGKCFRFNKAPHQQLDILAPPMAVPGIVTEGGRVKLVRSRLHGHLTPEACFIEEGLRVIDLAVSSPGLSVIVPSPVNMLILKLFAFDDRDSVTRRVEPRAQAHAYDLYIIVSLSQRPDYLEGREFLSRHGDSNIVQKARSIVATKFATNDQSGWRHVLMSSAFYPGEPMNRKQERVDDARRRLLRWFE
jgi:hypothetical protein